nr:hypothetical protein [Tanacetum cinerariifolium]
MTWYATGKCTEPDKMQHPVDGRVWKDFDIKYSDFAAKPRNVRLGLAADGINPFGNLNQSYNMWPVILTTYNLPSWLCMKESSFMLMRLLEFNGETKNKDPPREFSQDAIMTQLARLPTRVKGKHLRHRQGKTGLEKPRHSKWLVARPKQKREVLEASGCIFFHTRGQKKFCQFIKGVKLPDGFGSNFKHKVTNNDTNITGLKSHDCHIMMQRLLPNGLQQYLPLDVAKSLIKLCLFFKQICSQTLMMDDMLKALRKVIDILCNLELIYPPVFFNIMIHLVIHLPLEAYFGRPICPEEALTFSSYYVWDVTTKFNRLDRNVDCPPLTCQFHVFKSLCKLIGLRSVIRIDHQELKNVIWYVLHNSPGINTYRAKFKIEFPNKYMKEEFPDWFGKQIRQHHVDNDPGVNESSELFALASGPSQNPISVNSCVVNGVRFVVHSRDERHTTQNSSICSRGPDEEMYYDQLEQILEAFKNDQYILATQVKQYFYLKDMARRPLGWKVVKHVSRKKFLNGGVIMVEDDPDVIHVNNLSDLTFSTSFNDLEIAALHIDGQSIDVDAPPDFIDISSDVARGHGGDGDDRSPPYHVPTGYGGCLGNEVRAPVDRRASRLHTLQETRNLKLKAITDKTGLILIQFEVDDRETLMPLDEHAAHWANYLGELVRELPLHYPSWRQMPSEWKARVVEKIGTQFDLRPHIESNRWPQIYAGIQQHLQKIYNGKKDALKERY